MPPKRKVRGFEIKPKPINLKKDIEWFQSDIHSSLMGCIRCQQYCPVNRKAVEKIIRLEGITEEETKMILEGKLEEKLALSIGRKLKMFDNVRYAEYYLPVIKRNLEVLLNQK